MNHMLIGLGGTGGRILCNYRKTLLREFPSGRGEPVRALPDGRTTDPEVRLGYLYVDSDVDDLDNADDWRVFGESVRLETSQKQLINRGDLGAAIGGISRNPAISRWIGDQPHMQKVLKDTGKTPGAGQIRRRGRFLFAHAARDFSRQVSEEVKRLKMGATAQVAFHVCCTLAAGTGSGSIIDALALLRRQYPDAQDYPIYVYALITGSEVGDVNTGNFYANQYAALSELNAYMLNDYDPHDVTGSGERMEETRDRVQACYLVTDINRENHSSSREDQERMIAEYLYNRIVAFKNALSIFSRTWTLQDVSHFPGEGGRSHRFGSIGVKRWAIPEAEIREKLALGFVQSSVRQMLYNHWQRDFGYQEKAAQLDAIEIPVDSLHRWYLGDEQSVLNHDFELDGQMGSVPPWDEEWANIVNYCINQVQQERATDKASWLREIEDRVYTHLERHFRDRGVARYYNERTEAVSEYAARTLAALEKDLYGWWRNGTYGLHDVQRVLEQLRKDLTRRVQLVEKQEIPDVDKIIAEGEGYLRDAQIQWAKIGWLSELVFKKRTRQLGIFASRLRSHCYHRTLRQALVFKSMLLEEVGKLVDGLNGTVVRISHHFRELARKVTQEAEQRCVVGGERHFDEPLVREYNPRAINDISRALQLREHVQQTHAGAVRESLEMVLGADPSLTSLDRYMAKHQVRALIEAESLQSADAQHSQAVNAGAEPVLNVSIVEKLRQKYSGNLEELRNDVEGFMRKAATAFLLDDNQDQPGTIEGKPDMPAMPIRRMVVFLPGADLAGDPFVNELKERFSRSVAGVTVDVQDSDRPHEITVLAADYWMAARFFRAVAEIRRRYGKRLSADGNSALEVHIEDHEKPLADLFVPQGPQTAKQGAMLRFLGTLMGALEECDVEGRRAVAYVEKNASGRRTTMPVRVADRWSDFERLSLPELRRLDLRMRTLLQAAAEAEPDLRASIQKKIDELLEQTFERCNKDNDHPEMVRATEEGNGAKIFIAEVLS